MSRLSQSFEAAITWEYHIYHCETWMRTGCFNSHFQLEIMPGNFIKEYSYCFSILNEHSNKHPALNKHLSPGQLYQTSTPLK